MPAKRKKERVAGAHFVWLLGRRAGVYYADGRSSRPPAGRHSLGTRDRADALKALEQLDLVMAVKLGRADKALLTPAPQQQLSLAEGRRLYLQHVGRPRVTGGARPASAKRYRPVFDKFELFAAGEGITCWNQVTRRTLEAYAAHLDDAGFAYATEYLELTTLKQVLKWLVEEEHLPPSSLVRLPLSKPQGTATYCWRPEEVREIVQLCRERADLGWLADVLTALACTGLRISELAALRLSDVDRDKNLITLTDDSTRGRRTAGRQVRQTKSGRSRSFPMHRDLLEVLDGLTPATDGLVFHGPRGGRLKPDTVRQVLIREVLAPLQGRFATPQGGSGFADGRLHSFRHFFCSACAGSGVPEQVVMEWLGHSESKMVRHYFHLHDAEAQRQMKRLNFVGKAGDGVVAGDVSNP
jgi:integrase